MSRIDYFNLGVGITGCALAVIAYIKSRVGRHSFSLYIVSGFTLIIGSVICLTTGAPGKAVAELVAGILIILYIYSQQGSIRIRD